jgi:hypothetical protein
MNARELRELYTGMTPAERQGERRNRLHEIGQELSSVMRRMEDLRAEEAALRHEKIQLEAALLELPTGDTDAK